LAVVVVLLIKHPVAVVLVVAVTTLLLEELGLLGLLVRALTEVLETMHLILQAVVAVELVKRELTALMALVEMESKVQ
jgi:hypothetical protein